MLFQSFLRSSQLEILVSKRVITVVYGFFGSLIMAWWFFDARQFVSAYRELHAFDVSVRDFFTITFVIMLPLFLVGCVLLRNVLQRFRLQRWFKNQINVPLYTSIQRPAVAGYLADYEFGIEEVQATLLDLHIRGLISISEDNSGSFVLTLKSYEGAYEYERVFMQRLFNSSHTQRISSLNDQLLLVAGRKSHDFLTKQMQSMGFLPSTTRLNTLFRSISRLIYCFSGLVAMISIYGFVFQGDIVATIGYPRYPVEISQLWLLGAITAAGGALIASGLWPAFTENSKSNLSAKWLEAAGFRYYLSTVFQDRLSLQHVRSQDIQTIRLFAAYMIAFRLVPGNSDYIRAILRQLERGD